MEFPETVDVVGIIGYAADIDGGEVSRVHAPAVLVPTALARMATYQLIV